MRTLGVVLLSLCLLSQPAFAKKKKKPKRRAPAASLKVAARAPSVAPRPSSSRMVEQMDDKEVPPHANPGL